MLHAVPDLTVSTFQSQKPANPSGIGRILSVAGTSLKLGTKMRLNKKSNSANKYLYSASNDENQSAYEFNTSQEI